MIASFNTFQVRLKALPYSKVESPRIVASLTERLSYIERQWSERRQIRHANAHRIADFGDVKIRTILYLPPSLSTTGGENVSGVYKERRPHPAPLQPVPRPVCRARRLRRRPRAGAARLLWQPSGNSRRLSGSRRGRRVHRFRPPSPTGAELVVAHGALHGGRRRCGGDSCWRATSCCHCNQPHASRSAVVPLGADRARRA